jgi:hypothetical protein
MLIDVSISFLLNKFVQFFVSSVTVFTLVPDVKTDCIRK